MAQQTILVFTTAYFPFSGGVETSIYEVSRRLSRDFDICVITARMRRDLLRYEVRPEGIVYRIGFGYAFDKWLLPLWGFFHVFWNLKFGIWKFTKSKDFVLWGVDISQGTMAAMLTKIFFPRLSFVATIQYGYGDERLSRGRMGLIGMSYRMILRVADHVTAISAYLLDTARSFGYVGPSSIIYNGVSLLQFTPKSVDSKNHTRPHTVITTSRLVQKNAVDILIRAVALLKKRLPDIRCVICGDGPLRNSLENLARDLGVTGQIQFLGDVPYADIPHHVREADIFVRASRSEGMGVSFVEALAMGLPIIGTSVGGIPDIIRDGETGLFARVDDPEDVAEKMYRLLTDEKLYRSIQKNGREMVVKKFNWDTIAQHYKDCFTTLFRARLLRIAIATPLFPPQLGGPGRYADNLAREFIRKGHRVGIVNFGELLRFPPGVRHAIYFIKIMRVAWRSDCIFSLDNFSVGFPARIASFLLRKPFILRCEGDFLWEQYVERTHRDITLAGFYTDEPLRTRKEILVKRMISWVTRSSDKIVFSSQWRRDMVIRFLHTPPVLPDRVCIIRNVWSVSNLFGVTTGTRKPIILWEGRLLYLKNLYRLIDAFLRGAPPEYELHMVGEGPEYTRLSLFIKEKNSKRVRLFPMPSRETLLAKYAESAFFILPSLSDVGPNVIAEAASRNTPFIMTKESGYTEYIGTAGMLIDPLDENDIAEKISLMCQPAIQEEYRRRLATIPQRTWSEAAEEWIELFKSTRNH